jgi:hypothetical protein
MKEGIRWAIGNAPGMNVILIAAMFLGGLALYNMRRETFPSFEL